MTTRRTALPQLEPVYDLKAAALKLGLADPDKPNSTAGQRFLRDGVNREHEPFPHVRINGQLKFKESQLVEILERHVNAPNRRTGRPRTAKKRIAKRPQASKPQAALAA